MPLSDGTTGASVTPVQHRDIREQLDALKTEHRDLDDGVAALVVGSVPNQVSVARLKKRKLRLRDEIAVLESRLIPDIIA